MEPRRWIGLMSGTSCDGVDAALVETRGSAARLRVRFVERAHLPYPEDLRRDLLAVMAPAATRTETLARLHARTGEAFAASAARLLERTGIAPEGVSAIGSHGQTVCHLPPRGGGTRGATLQIGEPADIAARTGIPTVADFRAADVALGGQGAPLVPWTDHQLYARPDRDRLVLNLGGIANVTHLPAGGGLDSVRAFDTGPGCMLLDELARRLTGDPHAIDRDGALSAPGTPDAALLEELLAHPFFDRPPPRSSGREEFGRGFADRMLGEVRRRGLSPAGALATAALLTARSLARAVRRFLPAPAGGRGEAILCGGGARNPTLVALLRREAPAWKLRPAGDLGIPAEAKECVSFAMLAAACLDGVPANLPQVTGASRPCILGKIVRV